MTANRRDFSSSSSSPSFSKRWKSRSTSSCCCSSSSMALMLGKIKSHRPSTSSRDLLALEALERLLDPLAVGVVLDQVERLAVVLARQLPVALDGIGLAEAVVDVPGGGMRLHVFDENDDGLVDLLLAEQAVGILIEVGLAGQREGLGAELVGRPGVALLLHQFGARPQILKRLLDAERAV